MATPQPSTIRRLLKHRPFRLIVMLLLLTPVGLYSQGRTGNLRISGASTIQPIVEELTSLYQERYKGVLTVSGGGSGAGIRDALSGNSDIGMVSRALRPEEQAQLQYLTIGLDTLVIIVNQRNPLTAMNRGLLHRIYAREIGDWNEISDYSQSIQLVNKEIGRSTLELFEDYTGLRHPNRSGSGPKISTETVEIGSNLESLSLVGGLPGAIGYVSMGTANQLIQMGMPVKILRLDEVEADRAAVIAGRYPIRRELNLVFVRRSPALEGLLELFQSPEAQAVLSARGFIPITR